MAEVFCAFAVVVQSGSRVEAAVTCGLISIIFLLLSPAVPLSSFCLTGRPCFVLSAMPSPLPAPEGWNSRAGARRSPDTGDISGVILSGSVLLGVLPMDVSIIVVRVGPSLNLRCHDTHQRVPRPLQVAQLWAEPPCPGSWVWDVGVTGVGAAVGFLKASWVGCTLHF